VKRWARQGREARLSQRRVDADDSSISGQSHDDEEAHADYEDLDGFIVESEEGEEQQDDFPVRCVCGATTPGRDAEYVPSTALIAFLGGSTALENTTCLQPLTFLCRPNDIIPKHLFLMV
jgi:hypothetical protein